MPAKGPCPKCRGEFVELERSGIKIDACRECRGVFLDRGELDQIIAAEQRAVANVYDSDENFFREMTGQAAAPAQAAHSTPPPPPATHQAPPPPQVTHQAPPPPQLAQHPPQPQHSSHHHQQYGLDLKTAERIFSDFRAHQSAHKKKHQKSLLNQLFD